MINLNGMCLIGILGDSCANCLAVTPSLKELAARFGLRYVRIDAEDDPVSAARFPIDRIPAVLLADDGKVFAQCSGYQPQEILELWIEAKLGEYSNKN